MPESAGGRRPGGWMKARVVALLAGADRPLSSVALTALLRREGEEVWQPVVFRTLRQLFDAGQLRRVELASGYLPAADEATAAALCRRCGAYASLEGAAPAAALRALAGRQGFRPTRVIVEIEGVCAGCRDGAMP